MCLKPLHGFVIGETVGGKRDIKICSNSVMAIRKTASGWVPCSIAYGDIHAFIDVPCGQCIECRLAYSRQWATRMVLESQNYEHCYFLTLTYNDDNLPLSYVPDLETGEAVPVGTLHKKDLQDFHKRLRRRLEYAGRGNFRYYSCGEYGSQSFRPHYHGIYFGLQLDDLKFLKNSFDGSSYYTSEFLSETWGHGFVLVADVTFESCAYVARYTTKKLTGDYKEFYETFNIAPEFSLMSRKPGIGRDFFDANWRDFYNHDEIILPSKKGSITVKPPRYYDNILSNLDSELYEITKERRVECAKITQREKLLQTNLSVDELAENRKELFEKRLKMLVRKEI